MIRWKKTVPFLLFLLAFALYVYFLSTSFEEWDSVQFAMGVQDYDVYRHQPHPPGYPVYVFLAWAVYQLSHQMIFSLAIISAVSAAAAILPFYYLAKGVFDERVAFVSTLLLMFNPGYWLTAEKTLSDGLAVALIISSVYLLHSGISLHHSKRIYWSSILLALSIGVRQTLFPFMLLWIVFLRKRRGILFRSGVLFVLTCIGWLVPMLYKTGFGRYLLASESQSAVLYGDSIFNASITFFGVLKRLFYEHLIKDYIWISYGALPYLEPIYLKALSVLSLGILAWLAIVFVLYARRGTWSPKKNLIALLLVPYGVWMLLMMDPLNDRYILPTIPWICLILGWLLTGSGFKYRRVKKIAIVLLILTTFIHSVYFANTLHNVPSAPTQLVNYVSDRYDPSSTLILCGTESRYFQYYYPEYDAITVYDPLNVSLKLEEFNGTVLITDIAAERLGGYIEPEKLVRVAVFERDTLAHRRNWRIVLYEYIN